ncbi:hypothetical protein E2L07_12370 [Halalkalibacterium halodurans]|uniref:hypothetical protein n=1 Tax=Halalkalibacterium halodurans TaxID=86665 RepID=UPI0010682FFA|nr:hypothetical protein [Halalkalibacterium halodurans]TES53596.1 hypothetical protein E2L07_12370 [Halalkalibacterium halodurans]
MKIKKVSFEQVILVLFSIAFILVDWRLGIMRFSDLFLIAIFLLLLLYYITNKNMFFQKSQLLFLVLLPLLLLTNILMNLFFNSNFLFYESAQGFFKIAFYLMTMILIFNFVRKKKLEENLLDTLSVTAVIVSFIGIYITISLYLNGIFPYEFFWQFNRQDLESYTYRGWDRSIIRTRSVFGEPAYLGFYLNTILAILYFTRSNYKIKKSHDFIITLTVLLTFSYSSILIMAGIKLLHYFGWSNFISFIKKKRSVISFMLAIILIGLFWDTVEKTVIIRTQEILSGTDGSGTARLQGSWSYVNWDNLFLGNGIGNTPTLFNVYAYILSDLGLVSFLLFLLFNGWLIYLNPKLALVFIALNFQRGGYLGAGYWIFVTLIILYSCHNKINQYKLRMPNASG